MTGIEKVAVLFKVLGTKFARPMAASMRPEEVSMVGEALVRLENDPPSEEQMHQVLAEFRDMMGEGGLFTNVNETLEQIFVEKFGDQDGPVALEEVRVNAQVDSPFKGLHGVPFSDLERILSEEHPQVQCAVLANIDADFAAGVLQCMEEERRMEMVERIATMRPPPARVLRDIADMFIEKTRNLPRFKETDTSGTDPSIKRAAEILNASQGGEIKDLLDQLGTDQPDLVEMIRDSMFTFDDLGSVDAKAMQKILGNIDTKLLAMALKSAPENVSTSIFGAVSARTKDMILEERELLGAVPLSEVKAAQKEIMLTIRNLIESGVVTVSGGKAEQLVE